MVEFWQEDQHLLLYLLQLVFLRDIFYRFKLRQLCRIKSFCKKTLPSPISLQIANSSTIFPIRFPGWSQPIKSSSGSIIIQMVKTIHLSSSCPQFLMPYQSIHHYSATSISTHTFMPENIVAFLIWKWKHWWCLGYGLYCLSSPLYVMLKIFIVLLIYRVHFLDRSEDDWVCNTRICRIGTHHV